MQNSAAIRQRTGLKDFRRLLQICKISSLPRRLLTKIIEIQENLLIFCTKKTISEYGILSFTFHTSESSAPIEHM